jgi:hypothetical protein
MIVMQQCWEPCAYNIESSCVTGLMIIFKNSRPAQPIIKPRKLRNTVL